MGFTTSVSASTEAATSGGGAARYLIISLWERSWMAVCFAFTAGWVLIYIVLIRCSTAFAMITCPPWNDRTLSIRSMLLTMTSRSVQLTVNRRCRTMVRCATSYGPILTVWLPSFYRIFFRHNHTHVVLKISRDGACHRGEPAFYSALTSRSILLIIMLLTSSPEHINWRWRVTNWCLIKLLSPSGALRTTVIGMSFDLVHWVGPMYFHFGCFYVLSELVMTIWFHMLDTLSILSPFSSAFILVSFFIIHRVNCAWSSTNCRRFLGRFYPFFFRSCSVIDTFIECRWHFLF